MTISEFRHHFYTEKKTVFNHNIKRFEVFTLENNHLFADGQYPTNIQPKNLPKSFIYIRSNKGWGYISTLNIVDIYYLENKYDKNNLKQDSLYISFSNTLNADKIIYGNYYISSNDFIIHGPHMIQFLEKLIIQPEYKNSPILLKSKEILKILKEKTDKIKNK